MNIEDVLSYQPTTSISETELEPSSSKRMRLESNGSSNHVDLGKLIEESDEQVNEIDESTLKRLILQFERKVLKNQEMRIKHSDTPSKFMDSELELFDTIKEMHVIATQPALFNTFVQSKVTQTLLGLLSHENTDVSCAVVALLQELTDLDDVDEIDEVAILMDALIDSQITLLLVNNMERLDESVQEESEGIHNSLAIIENLTDYNPELSKDVKPLITWLLKKLKSKPVFYPNKLYTSEILSILLQNSEANRNLIGSMKGIDILLHVIAYYKRHDPITSDEEEFIGNLFNCLCSALFMSKSNRQHFYKGEGIELMYLILKEKRKKESNTDVRVCALKVLNHSFSIERPDELLSHCCDKFVEILGLGVLMPIFLKPKSIMGQKQRKKQAQLEQVEEHTLSIILALLRYCKADNMRRVVNKFVESDMVKTERLVELHLKYSERLRHFDQTISQQETNLEEEQVFLKRLNEGGLFTLQIVDHILVLLCRESEITASSDTAPSTIKQRVTKLLTMHQASDKVDHFNFIRQTVRNYANEKDDQQETMQLLQLAEQF